VSKGRSLVVLVFFALLLGVAPIVGGINLLTQSGDSTVTCNGEGMEPGDTCQIKNTTTGATEDESYDQMKARQGPRKPWGIALIVIGIVVVIIFIRAIRNRIRQS
jgi:hypothetical protein